MSHSDICDLATSHFRHYCAQRVLDGRYCVKNPRRLNAAGFLESLWNDALIVSWQTLESQVQKMSEVFHSRIREALSENRVARVRKRRENDGHRVQRARANQDLFSVYSKTGARHPGCAGRTVSLESNCRLVTKKRR